MEEAVGGVLTSINWDMIGAQVGVQLDVPEFLTFDTLVMKHNNSGAKNSLGNRIAVSVCPAGACCLPEEADCSSTDHCLHGLALASQGFQNSGGHVDYSLDKGLSQATGMERWTTVKLCPCLLTGMSVQPSPL